ncbi:LacI family DNA-binding transcriptional regulator, partial [Bifidobacterium breve]|uniref:LacI family DNA-binding transcriptional regulator n=1 Tax=Bifidobacterium breve TaxID=1685 RepID=UPI001D02644E
MTKASIQAVAKETGVSISTVSRTFAKPDLVLPDTRDKVMAAAEKLDYSISRSAAALKSGQSFLIALLASETITTCFNANIFAGL